MVLLFVVFGEIIPPSFDFCLETQESVSPTTLSMKSFPCLLCFGTDLVLLESRGRYESFEHVHCNHDGFPSAGPTNDCNSTYGCTGSLVRVTSMTCCGLSSNRICLRVVSVEVHHVYQHFCRHGVIQKSREAAALIEFQSSVLCNLQVEYVYCIKIWSNVNVRRAPSWSTLVETSLVSGNDLSNGCIAEKKHVCRIV